MIRFEDFKIEIFNRYSRNNNMFNNCPNYFKMTSDKVQQSLKTLKYKHLSHRDSLKNNAL